MSLTLNSGFTIGPGVVLDAGYTPPPTLPKSLSWDGTDNIFVKITGNTSDWNLSNPGSGPGYWTIEWWEKQNVGAEFFNAVLCSAYPDGIDIYHNALQIGIWNGAYLAPEPTRGQWNHIALVYGAAGVKIYINGQDSILNGDSYSTSIMANGTANLIIGCRSPDGEATPFEQRFYGELANIKISNVARYSGTFTPTISLTTDANTLLAVSGELVDLTGRHTVTNNGVAISTDFPT
jgi:hypothetical protein